MRHRRRPRLTGPGGRGWSPPRRRGWVEQRGLAYVLAVKRTELLVNADSERVVAEQLAAWVPLQRWLRISTGPGAKGRRWYAWSHLPLATRRRAAEVGRWLLVRRSLTTGELAYYLCAGPASLPLVALVRVAGSRWRVEEAFQGRQGLCGLDHHQVRRWRSWYRWVTLAMLADAFLAVDREDHDLRLEN